MLPHAGEEHAPRPTPGPFYRLRDLADAIEGRPPWRRDPVTSVVMPRTPLSLAVLNEQRAALGLLAYTGADRPAELRRAALDTVLACMETGTAEPSRPVVRGAVRFLLDRLTELAPGRSVEVRVPPYAAVQCIDGPHHTRGTPPNVVEMEPAAWIALATGRLAWADAVADGRIRASGPRADLSAHLPLPIEPSDLHIDPAGREACEPG